MCGDQSLELAAFIKRLGCRGGPECVWVIFVAGRIFSV